MQVMGENTFLMSYAEVVKKMGNLTTVSIVNEKPEGAASFMVGTTEYFIPLGGMINVEEELAKLEADLKYQEGFLQSVLKKLSNEKFVSKAPANVIDMERKKQADAESKIASLKESIAALKNKRQSKLFKIGRCTLRSRTSLFLIYLLINHSKENITNLFLPLLQSL